MHHLMFVTCLILAVTAVVAVPVGEDAAALAQQQHQQLQSNDTEKVVAFVRQTLSGHITQLGAICHAASGATSASSSGASASTSASSSSATSCSCRGGKDTIDPRTLKFETLTSESAFKLWNCHPDECQCDNGTKVKVVQPVENAKDQYPDDLIKQLLVLAFDNKQSPN